MSTFQGLEMSRRALASQQAALSTTGHNISNVNTEGYSRQRVNFATTSPFPAPSRVQPDMKGQMGTGTDIGVVERIRNKFLDMQYRSENSRVGYWETTQDALSHMENVLNEPSDDGLGKTMDRFWQSLQDLADHPENIGTRSVATERGLAMAETLNHYSKSLQAIQSDLKTELDSETTNVNQLIKDIQEVNKQVARTEPHGMLANDLYDERDNLIDELSKKMNIKVHQTKTSDRTLEGAEGLTSVELLDDSGKEIEDGIFLLDVRDKDLEGAVKTLEIDYSDGKEGAVEGVKIAGNELEVEELLTSTGSLAALMKVHGYKDETGDITGDYTEMLENLDDMASEFAASFNKVHKSGRDADGDTGIAFFVGKDGSNEITADAITVNEEILKDNSLIAAGEPDSGSQNGGNAFALSDLFEDETLIEDTSIRKYYNSLIGEVGVRGEEAERMTSNAKELQDQVDNSRMSTSAVSLDEEMADLVKFQHAYNAAARNMTAVDELLDRVINQMGLVGR